MDVFDFIAVHQQAYWVVVVDTQLPHKNCPRKCILILGRIGWITWSWQWANLNKIEQRMKTKVFFQAAKRCSSFNWALLQGAIFYATCFGDDAHVKGC